MSSDDTIPVEQAVETYLRESGYTPSHVPLVMAELDEPGALPLDLLGEALPYSIKDGVPVIERARFDAIMARLRDARRQPTVLPDGSPD
jgi:hypothetical protein